MQIDLKAFDTARFTPTYNEQRGLEAILRGNIAEAADILDLALRAAPLRAGVLVKLCADSHCAMLMARYLKVHLAQFEQQCRPPSLSDSEASLLGETAATLNGKLPPTTAKGTQSSAGWPSIAQLLRRRKYTRIEDR